MKNKYYILLPIGILFCLLLQPTDVVADFKIDWQVMSISSGSMESDNFEVVGTMGQPFFGRGGRSGTLFVVNNGFLLAQEQEGRSCCLYPGDANADGALNLLDFLYLNSYIYDTPPGPAPPCIYSADANGDYTINLLDMLRISGWLGGTSDHPICPEL